VYVVACRVLEFVVLLVRDDRSKELEIVVLRYQLSILAVRQVGRGSPRATGSCCRR
jgi:hypothetical protein